MINNNSSDTSADVTSNDKVYANYSEMEANETMKSSVVKNNLTNFKKYLESDSDIQNYIGENGIVYSYDVNFDVYSYNSNHILVNSNADVDSISTLDTVSSQNNSNGRPGALSSLLGSSSDTSANNFSELTPGNGDTTVSSVVTGNYDVLYGRCPSSYDEVVLVLDKNNSISAGTLYQLGLITEEQYTTASRQIENGDTADNISFDYSTVCDHVFYLVPACNQYTKNPDGTFIIGCCSGGLGIILSLIFIIPINSIIQKVSGIPDITAHLSVNAAIVLILISIVITMIGGLFPAKKAAKKDPVIALRTE